MRTCLLATFLSVALFGQQKGSISGVVKDASTGQPLANVEVRVNSVDQKATTDSDGHFSLSSIPSGAVRLSLSGPTRGQFTSKNLTLPPGQDLDSLEVMIEAIGTISGKILDEDGEPLAAVEVFGVVKEFYLGRVQYRFGSATRTNDKGEYTLASLRAGRSYLIWAAKRNRNFRPVSDIPANPKLRRRITSPTFYPSSEVIEAAQPVTVPAGGHLESMDIHVRKSQSFCIEGVLDTESKPDALQFFLEETKPSSGVSSQGGMFSPPPGGRTGPDGKVRLCDVRPGEYKITAFQWPAEPNVPLPFYGTSLITVVDKDVSKIVVTAQPKVTVPGEIVWDGESPDQPVDKPLIVGLQPIHRANMGREQLSATAALPGEFSLPDLLVDEYQVRVLRLPAGFYVKEMTYGASSILHAPLQLGQGGINPKLRVVIARDGATLQSQVVDKDGAPVADATVVLLPYEVASEAHLAAGMLWGETDQRGAYTFAGLPPGKYRVLAANARVDEGSDRVTRLWIARDNFQKVEIGPKATVQLTLKPEKLD